MAATMASTAIFVFSALTLCFTPLDEMVSIRATADKMKAEQRQGEPLLAGKFALRGVVYYTGEKVSVLSTKGSPFWAAHPVAIIHQDDLYELLQEHPSALCTMRKGDWSAFCKSAVFGSRDRGEWIGENFLIRAFRPMAVEHAVAAQPVDAQPVGKKVPLGN